MSISIAVVKVVTRYPLFIENWALGEIPGQQWPACKGRFSEWPVITNSSQRTPQAEPSSLIEPMFVKCFGEGRRCNVETWDLSIWHF